ncbi:MAG: TMEM165/GDT1 family protein [Leptolyngbyaceae cyanobacterium SL_7_1]|nr:TMEM165/GDT1 family protein [Leptolyngbyaceae cyanobacterium SL_7_1]
MLAAFTAGLLLITVSELGDKTFFIAMILAMRHSRRLVLVGVVAALAVMTVLSVLLGQVVSLLPAEWVHYAEVVLFLGFGIKLLLDASRMADQCDLTEQREAEAVVVKAEKHWANTSWAVVLEAFVLTFVAEWGDRTQLATIALAAANHPLGVTSGAIIGHTICAAIAVMGGRYLAGRISERTITALGGILFLVFGAIAAANR